MTQPPLPPAHAEVSSPCVGVCRMDPADRWCVGCLRSRDEIGDWRSMTDHDKRLLWAQLAQRRQGPPPPHRRPCLTPDRAARASDRSTKSGDRQ